MKTETNSPPSNVLQLQLLLSRLYLQLLTGYGVWATLACLTFWVHGAQTGPTDLPGAVCHAQSREKLISPIILATPPLWMQLNGKNSSRGKLLCVRTPVHTYKYYFYPQDNSMR